MDEESVLELSELMMSELMKKAWLAFRARISFSRDPRNACILNIILLCLPTQFETWILEFSRQSHQETCNDGFTLSLNQVSV